MQMIRGIDVVLHERVSGAPDPFGNVTYTESDITISNVLVSPTSTTDQIDTFNLTGKKSAYTLYIPKGDNHNWTNAEVTIRGVRYKTIGIPKEYIEGLLPLQWNKQIEVEHCE